MGGVELVDDDVIVEPVAVGASEDGTIVDIDEAIDEAIDVDGMGSVVVDTVVVVGVITVVVVDPIDNKE